MRFLRMTIVTAVAAVLTTPLFGAGFSIFEQGAKASAMGGAFTATANDPSAIFYNPAGIAQQRNLSILAGATFINFANEFTGDPNSPVTSGVEGKYNRHTFVPPNAYVVIPVGNNLTVGFGAFSAFGLRTDWQDPWAGRYVSKDADLKTMSFNPAIAWQTTDGRLAIGGGVEYRRARVILNANRLALNPYTGRISDIANTRLVSDYGSSMGWNAGILFKPSERFRLGASYRAKMDIDLDGQADVTQIKTNTPLDAIVATQLPPDQAIKTTFPFPSIMAAGVAFSPSNRTDIEFDYTRMTWSEFGALAVQFQTTPAASFTREQNWKDSSSYRLGTNIAANEHWDVRLGAVYDENPQPTEHVSPLLPDSDRIGATLGTGWHNGPFLIDWSLMVLHFKDRDTQGLNTEGFNGTYKTDALLWTVDVGYKF